MESKVLRPFMLTRVVQEAKQPESQEYARRCRESKPSHPIAAFKRDGTITHAAKAIDFKNYNIIKFSHPGRNMSQIGLLAKDQGKACSVC
jgi:hypothetical protein